VRNSGLGNGKVGAGYLVGREGRDAGDGLTTQDP
jgi:hypothetical protein